MPRYTLHDLVSDLRGGKYTSVGSYPKYWITSDGGALSYEAIRENIMQVGRSTRDGAKDGWCVVACAINYEDPELFCDHTGNRIESAYAEPEEESLETLAKTVADEFSHEDET